MVLEDEVKPMDIRNSVVWTGKIPEKKKESNENKIEAEKNEEEVKKEEQNNIKNIEEVEEKEDDINIVDDKGIIIIYLFI